MPLGGGGSGTKGIAAHFGLATARRPLGVFEATMRDDKDESESVRWPPRRGKSRAPVPARGSSPCARATELLSKAVATDADLVVRSSRSKRRRVLCENGSEKGLWDGGTTGADDC